MKKQIDNTFTEMPKFLKTFIAPIMADGICYDNIESWWSNSKQIGENIIILNPSEQSKSKKVIVSENALHDTEFFKFHKIHNGNVPIPMTEMYGVKVEERPNSVKMDLWDEHKRVHWIGWLLKSWILEGD